MTPSARVDPLFLEFQLAIAGRYSLDRELGRGGMGVVYLAREVQLDRLVAIKLLPPERAHDDTLRERFLREARLAAKLSHPNIIPIFAVDEVDGHVFYVMAYVDGETLGERVRSRGPLASSEATRVLREVAWALGYAHGQGVVHRDVKPENIMIERGSGRALVTDFGIAAALDDQAGPEVVGTPEYMSPEQALGKELDARSDVYALGATAHFLCTGQPPFRGANSVEVLAHQVATKAPPLASAGTGVPRRLAQLVDRCLAKDPARRPSSASSVAEQLSNAIEERRDVPAALRAFVKRDGRIGGMGTAAVAYLSMGLLVPNVAMLGPLVGVPLALGVALAVPFTYLTIRARGLLRRGFAQSDVAPAFDAEIAQLKEEYAVSGVRGREGAERAMGIGAVAAAGVGVAATVFDLTLLGIGMPLSAVGGLSFTLAFLLFLGRVALRSRRPQASAESWRDIWAGRIGRAAFAVARVFGGKPTGAVSTTHRNTELAIGLAAGELFASLPKATRQQLGDVPSVVAKLQRDAAELRASHERLHDHLSDAGDAASTDAYAELRALRDELGERHREVVAALETTRLNLLRLHAGAMTVDGFTTHFDLAGDVAAEARRLLEARGELDRFLRSPGSPTPTPG